MSTRPGRSDAPAAPHLVLVTGAGRSGTSTIAGTLYHLGLHVPEPVMQANPSNPKGFFESWWPVRFHNQLLQRASVEQTDGRPDAADLVAAEVGPKDESKVEKWVAALVAEHDLVVVKDPRAVWVPQIWSAAAEAAGARLSFLTMLRHPAEVIGSRQERYSANRPWIEEWDFAVWNLCGWINGNLTIERQTRGSSRTYVLYDQLLDDWRSEAARVQKQLGVPLDVTPEREEEIDGFIDPALRRHRVGWDGLDMPVELTDIADGVLDALERLAAAGGNDPETEAVLDELHERYTRLYRVSRAISQDAAAARGRRARALGVQDGRKQARAELAAQQEAQQEAPSLRQRSRRLAGRVARRVPPLRRLLARRAKG